MIEVFGLSLSLLLVVAGTSLCVLEAFAPGAHFVVIGVALLVAGLVGLFVPGAATPYVLAGLVLAAGFGALFVYRHFDFYTGTGRGQTSNSSDLRGVRGYVLERVTERSGKVKLANGGFDPTYAARTISDDIEEGEEVVVVDPGGGNVVTVEAVDGRDDIDRALDRENVGGAAATDADREGEMDSASESRAESNAEPSAESDTESSAESEADETA